MIKSGLPVYNCYTRKLKWQTFHMETQWIVEVVKQKKVAVLLQKALTFVPRVTIEPLNLIAKVINHLRIGFLVLVL